MRLPSAIARRLGRLLHIANSSPPSGKDRKDRFYAMKQRILKLFGTEDGRLSTNLASTSRLNVVSNCQFKFRTVILSTPMKEQFLPDSDDEYNRMDPKEQLKMMTRFDRTYSGVPTATPVGLVRFPVRPTRSTSSAATNHHQSSLLAASIVLHHSPSSPTISHHRHQNALNSPS